MKNNSGKVYLVGAGPGDPGLITLKGLEAIQKADVLIYDHLASPLLLKEASKKAEKIYVGKKGGHHTLAQDKINALIIQKVKKGLVVTRLKGGDPFIFGRGGEEVEELINENIFFEIVPGVTSGIAAPAYAGIPLTHRDYTSTIAFVTGHEDPTKDSSRINWQALAKGIGTLIFFMGVKNLPEIVRNLLKNGKDPKTPVGIVQWGTTPIQKSITGTLETIVHDAAKGNIKAPAIIVIGEVVHLRSKMKWFENRPLFGKRILVTRACEQASDLVNRLRDLGAECIEFPTIQIAPIDDWQPLDRAIDKIATYEWLVFTSVNGVRFFFKGLFKKGLDARALGNISTASIGPATAKKLLSYGIKSDIVPKTYRAESVIEAFGGKDMAQKKVLLPRAAQARPILPVELSKMGAIVDEIKTYQTLPVLDNAKTLIEQFKEDKIDLVTFTSSSTVNNFNTLLETHNALDIINHAAYASIGPITTDTAKNLGFHIDVTAQSFTIPGLCSAILDFYHAD